MDNRDQNQYANYYYQRGIEYRKVIHFLVMTLDKIDWRSENHGIDFEMIEGMYFEQNKLYSDVNFFKQFLFVPQLSIAYKEKIRKSKLMALPPLKSFTC